MAIYKCCSLIACMGLSALVACTAINAPDDAVSRCGNATDCPSTQDERFVPTCVFGDETDVDSAEVEKICVADFKSISCSPPELTGTSEWSMAYASLTDQSVTCDAEQNGSLGCPQSSGQGCDEGLEVNENGVCDTPGNESPAIARNSDNLESAVRDQYCRSFFGDSGETEWVCVAAGTSTFNCQQCDPSLAYGEGGCGTLYVDGEPACFYTDESDGPDASVDSPNFGDCS